MTEDQTDTQDQAAQEDDRADAGPAPSGPPPQGVYEKLLAAQDHVAAIQRTGTNPKFSYDYYEEVEVLRVCRAALIEAGLVHTFTVDEMTDTTVETSRGGTIFHTDLWVTFTLTDPATGDQVVTKMPGRGMDTQDKGPAKALVAALKYYLLKQLLIPTGDDSEREHVEGERPGRHARQQPREKPVLCDCPECGGPMWDNRNDPKSSRNGGKRPDWKCRSKECDHAIWGEHPDEPEASVAPEPEQEPEPDLPDLDTMSSEELREEWQDHLASTGNPHADLAWRALALVFADVRDDPDRWVKDNFKVACELARAKGIGKVLKGAVAKLREKEPMQPRTRKMLQEAIDYSGLEEGSTQRDWYVTALNAKAEPLAQYAYEQLQEIAPTPGHVTPPTEDPDDDLPF